MPLGPLADVFTERACNATALSVVPPTATEPRRGARVSPGGGDPT
jgi:hypothetical protein